MTRILWTSLGAIVAINVVVLAGAAVSLARDRHRYKKEMRHLEALWGGERGHVLAVGSQPAASRMPHHRPGRKLTGVAAAVAILCAATALAIPEARRAVVSVLGTVAEGLQLVPSEPETSAAGRNRGLSSDPTSRTSDLADATSGVTGPGGAGDIVGTPSEPFPPIVVTPPDSPNTVTAVPDSSSHIEVTWDDVATETGYVVERLNDEGSWAPVATLPQGVTSYSDMGLNAGTYFYRVSASNAGGQSPPSDVTSATTLTDPPSSPSPVAAVAVSSTEILLTWDDVGNETLYRIQRSDDGIAGWVEIATTGQDVANYSDTGLTADSHHHYRVIAENAGGESPPSEVVSAVTDTGPAGPSPADAPAP